MLNHVSQHVVPHYWSTIKIKPLHKGGSMRTIEANYLVDNLMEVKFNIWAEKNDMRYHIRASF